MFLPAVMQKINVHLFCVYSEIINAAYCNILPFAKPSQSAKWGGGDLGEVQVDVPLSLSHSCVCPHRWAL